MARFRYTINDADANSKLARLRRLATPDQLDRILERITRKVGVLAEQEVGEYPPARPPVVPKPRFSKRTGRRLKDRVNEEYIRTGVLGASLTSRAIEQGIGNAWLAVIGSKIEYAPYVWGLPSDDPGQAWFHRGVWVPLEIAVQQNPQVYVDLVRDELMAEINAFFI